MPRIMVCWGFADGTASPAEGKFVRDYDPDAVGGLGSVSFTDDPAKAKRWPDLSAALEEYRRISGVRPHRPDGLLNRPLTAYNIEFRMVDQ